MAPDFTVGNYPLSLPSETCEHIRSKHLEVLTVIVMAVTFCYRRKHQSRAARGNLGINDPLPQVYNKLNLENITFLGMVSKFSKP